MNLIDHYFMPFVYLLNEMAPYLLLGFLFAGVLHAFVPKTMYHRYLGRNNTGSVLCAILFGVPLPLCSCGVIPTAVGMRKEGASKGATTAFLIATPQTGIDSILATYSVFGWGFALLRPLVAMITGLIGGLATNAVEGRDAAAESAAAESALRPASAPKTLRRRCLEALDYGFTDMLMDIGQWLVVGIVLAGLITIFVPDDFFLSYGGHSLLNMLLVLLIACPMYVCATGSIPIAAALMLKGLSPGAALVFLMAGPATNMASIMVLGKTLGRKSLAAYLVSIVTGAILFGLAVDTLLPAEWFSGVMAHSLHSACCHTEATPWWQVASTVLLVALMVRALFLRHHGHGCHCGEEHDGCHCGHDGECCSNGGDCHCNEGECHCNDDDCHCNGNHAHTAPGSVRLKVTGMMCNHCRAHVEEALTAVEGAEHVSVDLGSGVAVVEGHADAAALIAAVEKCGYNCEIAADK